MALLVVGAIIQTSQSELPADDRLDIADGLATITVVFLLFIYALVIVACLKLRGKDETADTYRANTVLIIGIVGDLAVLAYTLIDDPAALLWVAGLLGVGLVLFLAEKFFGHEDQGNPQAKRANAEAAEPHATNKEL